MGVVVGEQRATGEVPRLAPGPLAPRVARLFVERLAQQGDPEAVERGMGELGARCVLPRQARGLRGSLKRLELFYTRVLGCEVFPPQREGASGRLQVLYCPLGRHVFCPQGTPGARYCEAMARGVLGEASERLAVHVEQAEGGLCDIQVSESHMEPVSRKIHGMDVQRLKTIRDRLAGPSSAPVVAGVEARAVWEGRLNRSLVHIGPFTFQGKRISRPTRHFTIPFGTWCEAEEMMGVESPSDRIEPQEALLASLAACINAALAINAALEGIELEEMETIVRKKIVSAVTLGMKSPGPEPYSIVYEVRVKGKGLTEERLARLEEFVARSPVDGLLTFPQRVEGRIVRKK